MFYQVFQCLLPCNLIPNLHYLSPSLLPVKTVSLLGEIARRSGLQIKAFEISRRVARTVTLTDAWGQLSCCSVVTKALLNLRFSLFLKAPFKY